MAITLKTLIHVAPFPEDHKKILLGKYDQLTEEEKYELSSAAWQALAEIFYGKLEAGKQLIMDEVLEGKKTANPNDFMELEARLLHEFAQKLDSSENEKSIEEVKKQLEVYKTKPLATDSLSPTPLSQNS